MPTVYVIDDERELCSMLQRGLMLDNYRVETFHDPRAFLATWRPQMKGCILCDVVMPNMNGLSLMELLLERGCDLPFIVMTAYANLPMAAQALQLGAFDFLEKPFSMDRLSHRIKDALRSPDYREAKLEVSRQKCGVLRTLLQDELQVFQMLVKGQALPMIAQTLGMSNESAKELRRSVMQKLGASNLADLVWIQIADSATNPSPTP